MTILQLPSDRYASSRLSIDIFVFTLGSIGSCGYNGEDCTLVETTLVNSIYGSSTDISLISPYVLRHLSLSSFYPETDCPWNLITHRHKFSVETTFKYVGGCDDDGATCASASCNTAFHAFDDWYTQVACTTDDVRGSS